MTERLFKPYQFAAEEKIGLDRDGHFVLPGLLTEEA